LRLAPLRQRRGLIAGLYLVNRIVVLWSIGLGASDNHHVGGWSVDALGVLWQFELVDNPVTQIGSPSLRSDQKGLGLCTSCSPAGRSEHIGPRIEHRQEKVAAIGVGRTNDH